MKKLILTSIVTLSAIAGAFLYGSNPAQAFYDPDEETYVCTYSAHGSVFLVETFNTGIAFCPIRSHMEYHSDKTETVDECTVTVHGTLGRH